MLCSINNFKDAPTFISYIRRHRTKILKERITGFYIISDEENRSNSPIIFVFESFAVQVDYYFHSELRIIVVDIESFCDGELTRHIFGDRIWNGSKVPFDVPPYAPILYKHIEGIEISRFDHPFESNPFRGKTKLYGGDYFHKISLLFEDTKFTVFSEPATSEGYMRFEFEELDEKRSNYLDLKDVWYERIL